MDNETILPKDTNTPGIAIFTVTGRANSIFPRARFTLPEHYGAAVIPARAKKPKDKSKVEAGVLLAERWILARLCQRTFLSLTEINEAIHGLLEYIRPPVPKTSRLQAFDVRITSTTVEILRKGKRICSHFRSRMAWIAPVSQRKVVGN